MIKVPEFLSNMFSDPRFHLIGRNRYGGKIDGSRIGSVLATRSPPYDQFALNRGDNENLLAAKRGGKIDQAFIVAAKLNGVGPPEYCAAVEAEEFQPVLAGKPTRPGRFGDFWTLYLSEFSDDEWTM